MAEGTQRRLAAVVSADVVGYSRLMGVDETGTLAALRSHRAELIDGKIAEHGGRIVKTMGDGLLIEFPSVVDATQCMIEVQQGMAKRNEGVDEGQRIVFRIGINLGDIIIEGEDIHGDGVNIAARLQEISEPGGVAISRRVYEDVQDRLDVPFDDAGEQALKNIARPVNVWRWSTFSSASTSVKATEPVALPDKPSVAVLPFDNMSGDPEQDYFADGLTEEIITALSKISRMRVIARNSAFAYKGKALDLRQVASEMGVRFVLEGSIRSGGNRLRITAQLIDASDGSHIWAERFDRTIDDIFDIQDDITKEIVTALRVKLTDGELAAVWSRGTNNIEAWQHCVRANELQYRFNTSDYLEARAAAEKAVALDPNYAQAWATLGFTHWWDGRLGFTGDSEAKFAKAEELAKQALSLDDTLALGIGLSVIVADAVGRYDEAITIAERGCKHHPGNADIRAFLAFAVLHAGLYVEAAEHYRAAMSLNPFAPNWYHNGLCRALMLQGELDQALEISDSIIMTDPNHLQSHLYRAYILQRRGCASEVNKEIRKILRLAPKLGIRHLPRLFLHKGDDDTERFLDVMRKAGLPE
jgi:adenylate cyclase